MKCQTTATQKNHLKNPCWVRPPQCPSHGRSLVTTVSHIHTWALPTTLISHGQARQEGEIDPFGALTALRPSRGDAGCLWRCLPLGTRSRTHNQTDIILLPFSRRSLRLLLVDADAPLPTAHLCQGFAEVALGQAPLVVSKKMPVIGHHLISSAIIGKKWGQIGHKLSRRK